MDSCVSLTREKQDVEGLVGVQDHQIWSKHHTSCLLRIVVHLLLDRGGGGEGRRGREEEEEEK